MKRRIRFGVKGPWFAPNATVFVFYRTQTEFLNLLRAIDQARLFLPSEIASKIVCEDSTPLNP